MDVDIESFLLSSILNRIDDVGTSRFTVRQLLQGYLVKQFGKGVLHDESLQLETLLPGEDLDAEVDILDALPKAWEEIGAPAFGYRSPNEDETDPLEPDVEPLSNVRSAIIEINKPPPKRLSRSRMAKIWAGIKASSETGLQLLFGQLDPQLRLASVLGAFKKEHGHRYRYELFGYDGLHVVQQTEAVGYAKFSSDMKKYAFEIDPSQPKNYVQFFGGVSDIKDWSSEEIRSITMKNGYSVNLTAFDNTNDRTFKVRGADASRIADHTAIMEKHSEWSLDSILLGCCSVITHLLVPTAASFMLDDANALVIALKEAGVKLTVPGLNPLTGVVALSGFASSWFTRFGYNSIRRPSSMTQPYFDFVSNSGLLIDVGTAAAAGTAYGAYSMYNQDSHNDFKAAEYAVLLTNAIAQFAYHTNLFKRETGGMLRGDSAALAAIQAATGGSLEEAKRMFEAEQAKTRTFRDLKQLASFAIVLLKWAYVVYNNVRVYNDFFNEMFNTAAGMTIFGVGGVSLLVLIVKSLDVFKIVQKQDKITAGGLKKLLKMFMTCVFIGSTLIVESNVGAFGVDLFRNFANTNSASTLYLFNEALNGMFDNDTVPYYTVYNSNNVTTNAQRVIYVLAMWNSNSSKQDINRDFVEAIEMHDKIIQSGPTLLNLKDATTALTSNSILDKFLFSFLGITSSLGNLRFSTTSVFVSMGSEELLGTGVTSDTLAQIVECNPDNIFKGDMRVLNETLKVLAAVNTQVTRKNYDQNVYGPFIQRYNSTVISDAMNQQTFENTKIGKIVAQVKQNIIKKSQGSYTSNSTQLIFEALLSAAPSDDDEGNVRDRFDVLNRNIFLKDEVNQALKHLFINETLQTCGIQQNTA